jgi:hypothetical protein
MKEQNTGITHPVGRRRIFCGFREMLGKVVEETVLRESVQIGEERFYKSLMEMASPSIDLIRAGIVQ